LIKSLNTSNRAGGQEKGAGEQRSRGAEEQGSRGAGEQGSRGAEEQGSRSNEHKILFFIFQLSFVIWVERVPVFPGKK
jgi:hypothetical protein